MHEAANEERSGMFSHPSFTPLWEEPKTNIPYTDGAETRTPWAYDPTVNAGRGDSAKTNGKGNDEKGKDEETRTTDGHRILGALDSVLKFKEGDHCKFEPIPAVPQFRNWKSHFKKVVAGVSGRPERAFQWITEIETAKCLDDLQRSGDFETLDAKVAAGLG